MEARQFLDKIKLSQRFEDKSEYKKLLLITPQDFNEIFGLIQDDITKTAFINYRVDVMIRACINRFLDNKIPLHILFDK